MAKKNNKKENLSKKADAINEQTVQKEEIIAEETENLNEEIQAEESENAQAEPKMSFKEVLESIRQYICGIEVPGCIMRLLGCYFIVMAYFIYKNIDKINPISQWQEFVKNIPILPSVLIIAAGFIFFTSIKRLLKGKVNTDSLLLSGGVICFSLSYLWKCNNFYYCVGFIAVSAIVIWFCYNYGGCKLLSRLPKWSIYTLVGLLAIASGLFIGVYTVYKHYVYWTATFDFGIFLQMYHYMAETLEPLTTCERNELLSHFAVHFSPVYYLLLPFYYFFPSANTLLIAQAVLAVIGVIPLMLICRNRKFSNAETLCFGIIFLFCCGIVGPCFYDFHENAFLPAILLWFFYAIEKRKYVFMYIMLLLLLSVKEDVALYAMLISLYCAFNLEKRYHGVIMFSISGIYFAIVTSLMNQYGEGVMTSRTYGNLMTEYDAGLGNVVKTVITNPAYFITQCLNEDDFKFFLIMLIPLAFMPFVSKKFTNYFLIAPFLLTNLATGYGYAKDIGYQYVFGTSTCLIYCALINYTDIKSKKKQFIPMFMALATVYSFAALMGDKSNVYDAYKNNKNTLEIQDRILASIPDDASVGVANAFLQPHLAQREESYLIDEHCLEKPETNDFIVVRTHSTDEWIIQMIQKIQNEGYTEYASNQDTVTVYVSPDYKEG
ncbi:MAG: DUF2079 domain-containing protein [Ruminococcus sp.]|nr:DUF2079 domain-containing protein [Ruminococcus sp.]MDY3843934.1 DUF2079 domain-containing protein [Ruminococcus sp.]